MKAVAIIGLFGTCQAGYPWLQTDIGFIDPEGVEWSHSHVVRVNASLYALGQRPKLEMDLKTKMPGKVDPSVTQHGEGNFVVIGDWGNPFDPGTGNDGRDAYWGPHWKCRFGGGARCNVGDPQYVRDDMSQINVAKHMAKWASDNKAQVVVNVGDNHYVSGFDSPTDAAWQHVFEERYADESLQIPWLSVLGNHDWGGFNCFLEGDRLVRADNEINYDTEHDWEWPATKKSRWVLPHPFYKKRITFGDLKIDFVAVDSNFAKMEEPCGQEPFSQRKCDVPKCRAFLSKLRDDGWDLIENELGASDADWKIVFAHHPLAFLGNWHAPQKNIIDLFKRVNVSMYLAGHTHAQKHAWYSHDEGKPGIKETSDKVPGAVFQIMTGGGGGAYSDAGGSEMYGFAGVKVTAKELHIEYVDDTGKMWYTEKVGRPCAQLHGSQCPWVAGEWGECEDGEQKRTVQCAYGPNDCDNNKDKPTDSTECIAPTPAPTPVLTPAPPAPDPSPTPSPDPSPTPDDKSGGDTGGISTGIVVAGIIVIAALVAGGVLWNRRQPEPSSTDESTGPVEMSNVQ